MTAHAERAHSFLGPSQAKRWRSCKASVALAAQLPAPPSSAAANAGTLAHEWAERMLRALVFDARPSVGEELTTEDGEVIEGSKLTTETADNINHYLGAIEKLVTPETELFIETRFDLSKYFGGTNDGDGTADCIVYSPNDSHLHVFDYKNGFLPVDAEGNLQAVQYALGALEFIRSRGGHVLDVSIYIVQPNAPGNAVKEWHFPVSDLWDEGELLKEDYEALSGPTTFVPGDHCKFCPVAYHGKCDALRAFATEKARDGFEPLTSKQAWDSAPVDPVEIGRRLEELSIIRGYCDAIEKLAEREAKAGRMPAGHKWVRTPGRRVWKFGEEETAEALSNLLADKGNVSLWEKSLLTPPALEKALGKKGFKEVEHLASKTEGGFKLVSESDRREAVEYVPGSDGFEPV